MTICISPKWADNFKQQVAEHKFHNGPHVSIIADVPLIAKYVITHLATQNVPFRVIQLGAGVKRITTETTVCPHCNGTGRC